MKKNVSILNLFQILICFLIVGFSASEALSQTSLEWASHVGGAGDLEVYDNYYDPVSDLVYLTGYYEGSDFPATIGSSVSQEKDAFIIAIKPDGTGIVWARLYGGSGQDYGYGIYTDANGDVFIQGSTASADLPVNGTITAMQTTGSGPFIARFGSLGTVLEYGTYLEGDHTQVLGMAVSGDNVYMPIRIDANEAAIYAATGFVSSGFTQGMAVLNINTSVGGTTGLEAVAHYGEGYWTNARNITLDQNGSVYITIENENFTTFPNLNEAALFTTDAAQDKEDLLVGFNNPSIADANLPILAVFSSDLNTLEYGTAFLPVKGISNSYEAKPYVDVDADGNIYLYTGIEVYDYAGESLPIVSSNVQQFNNLSGIPIPGPDDYIFSVVGKIPATDRSQYEWVNLFSGTENNGNNSGELKVDDKGRVHVLYGEDLNGGDSRLLTSNKLFSPNTGYPGNTLYTIFSPSGVLEYSTPITKNEGEKLTLTLDKASCTAYINTSNWGAEENIVTPTYYNEETNTQITVDNADPNVSREALMLTFERSIPNDNTITDFPPGEDEFCVNSYIYQNPNEGPITGMEASYTSGDGSSATHNLTDFYYDGSLTQQQGPNPAYQWQVSRNSGTTWDNIAGENLSVLKPESETSTGTVQYRRLTIDNCCDTTFSNVITATITGAFSLNVDGPTDPVYYCEGTAEPIPMTITGASGTISWQWYDGFTPLSNTAINPASGSGVAQGAFTAEIASTQTGEGFYRLVVTDANGCKKEASISFAKLTADAIAGGGNTQALCPGASTEATLGPSTVNPLFDYSWTGPGGFTSTDPNPVVTTTGDYFLQVKLTSAASFCTGGETTVTVSGTVPHDPALTTITDKGFCQPESPAPIGLSGTPPEGYVYQWSPGLNIDNQVAYSPNFDPGILPFGNTPIDSVTYTFTALRQSDGCIFETTVNVTDTAYALATVGSNRIACQTTTIGNATTTGLHFQWEAVSTDYASGLATLITDPVFSIDGVNANSGSNKFATVSAPIAEGEDCYTVTYVLRASYIPFPNTCFSTDTVSVFYCCVGTEGCPDPVATQGGTNGYCSKDGSLFFVPNYGLNVEWTTHAVDGVLQASGTEPRGVFSITADSTKSTAITSTGPHPYNVIVDFDDSTWGWAGSNSVTYQVRYYGFVDGIYTECSVELITFSGQNSTPVIGVNDLTLCGFPTPGVELGNSGLSTPYTITGANYSQAPNSAFIWTWEELNGGTASIDANDDTPFPTLSPTGTTDYLVTVQDPVTGCIALDTMTVTVTEVIANAGTDISGVCEGVLVQLGSDAQSNHNYTWSPTTGLEDPVGVSNSTSAQPFLVTPAAPAGLDYAVIVTETTTGCQATDTLILTTDVDPPTAMSDQVDSGCAGGSESAYFGAAQSGHTYSWSVHSSSDGGDLSWLSSTTATFIVASIPEGTAAGTYVFELTKTKGNCGSTTALYTITVYDSPTVDLGADITSACTTPYPEITTASEAGITYRWNPADNLFTDNAGTTPIGTGFNAAYNTVYVGPVSAPTDYIIRAYTGAPGYCSTYDTITVLPATTMLVNAGTDANYCPGDGAASLGIANTGTSHTWTAVGYNSDPEGTPATPTVGEATTMLGYLSSTTSNVTNFSQSSTVEGVYVYELASTSTEGCVFSDQVTVFVKAIPDGLVGPTKNTCAGNPVQIGTNTAATYSFTWSALSPSTEGYTIDNPNAPNPNVSPVVNTSYRAIITDNNTGCQTTQVVTVAVTEKPSIADATSSPLCKPSSNQDLTTLVSNYGTLFNPIWYANSIPGTLVSDPTMVLPSQTTDYFLIGENAYGCTDTATITLVVENPQTPDVIASISLLCSDGTVDLATYTPAPSDPNYTLEWHTNNSTSAASELTNTVVGAGTYYLFETTANACASASDNVVVIAPSELTAVIEETVACTNVIDTINGNPVGGSGVYATHTWTDLTTGTATGYILNNTDNQKLTIDASSATPGTIDLQYYVVDNSGCTYTTTHSVTIIQPDSILICSDASNYAVVYATTGLTNIVWYNSADVQVGTADSLEIDPNTAGMEDGVDSYYYTASDASGCDAGLCCPIVVTMEECAVYDWGDLPDVSVFTDALDYQTTAANNGPRHVIIDGLHLGPDVDEEADGQPDNTATGDGVDENGLTLFSSLDVVPGGIMRLPFSATNTTGDTAFVEMWVDWNGDGDFNDANEFVVDIHDGTNPLPTQVDLTVPSDVIDQQAFGVRLRISNTDNMTPYGIAASGEVEDYLLIMDCKRKVCLPATLTVNR